MRGLLRAGWQRRRPGSSIAPTASGNRISQKGIGIGAGSSSAAQLRQGIKKSEIRERESAGEKC